MIPIISARIFVRFLGPIFGRAALSRGRSPAGVTRQYLAHRFDQLRFWHLALRLRLFLQMLFAAFFRFRKLGADDQVFDRDFAARFLVGALDDDAR